MTKNTPPILVPALARGIAIIDLLSESERSMSASEILAILKLPKSSMHGLLQTLVQTHVLFKDDQQKYYLSAHIMKWSNAFTKKNDIISVFKSELENMPDFNAYTLTLTRLEGNEVVYIGHKESNKPLGFSFKEGMRLPAIFTATGKIILSTLDDPLIKELCREWPLLLTKNSVKNISDLMLEIGRIRKCHYSVDNGQIREGMYCIGTAICDKQGKAVAGLAVSLVKEEFSEPLKHSLIEKMHCLAATIKTKMGMA